MAGKFPAVGTEEAYGFTKDFDYAYLQVWNTKPETVKFIKKNIFKKNKFHLHNDGALQWETNSAPISNIILLTRPIQSVSEGKV